VKFLSCQCLLALADEDVVGEARGGRQPGSIDQADAIEECAFDAVRLLAEPRTRGLVESIVVTRVTDRRGGHGRKLELALEIFFDQGIERGVGRTRRHGSGAGGKQPGR
jgi:hypothetical protein